MDDGHPAIYASVRSISHQRNVQVGTSQCRSVLRKATIGYREWGKCNQKLWSSILSQGADEQKHRAYRMPMILGSGRVVSAVV